jgi:hypothetical protein
LVLSLASYRQYLNHLLTVRGSAIQYAVLDRNISAVLSSMTPIPELVQLDGGATLIFLSGNGVVFFESLDDDWY